MNETKSRTHFDVLFVNEDVSCHSFKGCSRDKAYLKIRCEAIQLLSTADGFAVERGHRNEF